MVLILQLPSLASEPLQSQSFNLFTSNTCFLSPQETGNLLLLTLQRDETGSATTMAAQGSEEEPGFSKVSLHRQGLRKWFD